ncbi:MAG: hypothetical protein ACJ8AT_39255 [Hyalangium sp.]|jgi:hypothetical protein|uniref:hypothetical protein n=1 Tax=Hyalangium sp. TaxID=2028555 RepID=UPI003899AF6B
MGDLTPREDPRKRVHWYERMVQKYPRLAAFDAQGVSRPTGPPTKPPRGPISQDELLAGLAENIRETAVELGYWQEQLREFRQWSVSGGPGSEEAWESDLLGGLVSRYIAEQRHWRGYLERERQRGRQQQQGAQR